ncbi:lysosomal Pro-X carboxypeptidase-like [Momordica charantia]|uniref:Lysosomal Pro-X carboxypeptidase-like n=1 Tax=Momordica charantia TaxID=3673 RepID=A0A6J1DHH2_MOMCH|nr:lysosomal Pro-X carboxypeptidase-like [Momordica charantia]
MSLLFRSSSPPLFRSRLPPHDFGCDDLDLKSGGKLDPKSSEPDFILILITCGYLLRRSFQNKPQELDIYDELVTFYYKQSLDHFNYQPQSYITFDQRYIINFKYWEGVNPNIPIFAYLGAEGSLDNDLSFTLPFASRYKAMVVYLEHRFYGQSIPFGSLEKAMKNTTIRGHLSSAQALADYAQVILHVKKMFAAETSPIIVIGGSYGGMLASWFRLKYPHIALGALASSAPVLYFDNITPQDGYYSVVSKSFRETSETCYEIIRRSWAEIDRIAEKPQGLSILSKRFKTCAKLNRSSDLKDYLDNMFSGAAQYNFPSENPVDAICAAIDGEAKKKTSDLIGQVFAGVVAYMGEKPCYDVSDSWHTVDPTDQYSFQICSEMVIPIGVSGKVESMFPTAPFDLNSFKNDCKAWYGVSPKPHWITTFYGGHDLKLVLQRFASNIIFSNGLKDPYSSGGVLHDISESIVAVTTAKGCHCLDILSAEVDDPDWLIIQRKTEMDIIDGWISKYHADLLQFKKSDSH